MKRSTKYILIIGGLVAVVVVGIVGLGVYTIYSTFRSLGVGREIPEELKEARVTTGEQLLRKTELFKLQNSGWIKTLNEGSQIADEKEREKFINSRIAASVYNFSDLKVIDREIVAVAPFGAFFMDLEGNVKRQVALDPARERVKLGPIEQNTQQSRFENLRIVRLDAQQIGFLSFSLIQGVRVFDSNGAEIWSTGKETIDLGTLVSSDESSFEKSSYVLQAAVGDLDGDGVSEYIVARQNDGVRAYDPSGREKWSYREEFPNGKLDVVDIDKDGKGELVVLGDAIRDARGEIVRELKSAGNYPVLSETEDGKLEVRFADIYKGKLTYSAEAGETLFSANAPLSYLKKPAEKVEIPGAPAMSYVDDAESVAFPKAVLVGLRPGEPKFLAVVASFIGIPRSNLYVYDQKGTLVYHELLPEEAETIAVAPGADGSETLLIGGKDTIWKYEAN